MKDKIFYTNMWQVYPNNIDIYKYDSQGKYIKDITLRNKYCEQMDISEMILKITKFSAFDTQGNEHVIASFSGHNTLTIKGLYYGYFLRSASVLLLAPGRYTSLRFYLKPYENVLVNRSKSEQDFRGDYIDFDVENDLIIHGNESPEAILRFDLCPFERVSFMRPLIDFLKKLGSFKAKLANGFSH